MNRNGQRAERNSRKRRLFALASVLILGAAAFLFWFPNRSELPPTENESRSSTTDGLVAADRATFIAVGDIMLSRGVARVIARAGSPDRPFSLVKDELLNTDFNFGNFESPVSGNDSVLGEGLVFNTRKRDFIGVVNARFKVVNLANNHILDQGLNGMRNTEKIIRSNAIEYLGVGEDEAEAWEPKYFTANRIRIAFIGASFSSVNDLGVTRNKYVARIEDVDRLAASITNAKAKSDIVVVTMHAGVEYTREPNKAQVNFARAAVDAGADIVIGAHPHWIQTVEEYHGRWIFYSLGNFIFDQSKPDTKEGLMLRIQLIKPGKRGSGGAVIERIDLLPIVIDSIGVPRLATPDEKQRILGKIGLSNSSIVIGAEAK